jgi:hypothetical protein
MNQLRSRERAICVSFCVKSYFENSADAQQRTGPLIPCSGDLVSLSIADRSASGQINEIDWQIAAKIGGECGESSIASLPRMPKVAHPSR